MVNRLKFMYAHSYTVLCKGWWKGNRKCASENNAGYHEQL